MPFIALDQPRKATDPQFPRVSGDEQAARDADAERLVRNEFDQDMPDDSRTALEREYDFRFGKDSQATQPARPQRGFFPLANADESRPARGFIPLEPEKPESPSLLKTIALENPATAIGEAALNLGSQAVALPIAGWAGLTTAAGNALGLTDREPDDVVRSVGDAMTYQPRGEFGKGATEIVSYPFQKLAEAGQWAGDKTLDATGSPTAATVVDTAINSLPMVIAPAVKGAKRVMNRPAEVLPQVEAAIGTEPTQGFVPLKGESIASRQDVAAMETRAQDIAGESLNKEWTAFADDSGTLGIPRSEMPQIMSEHRGAMTNFMNARGVRHHIEEVAADTLMPSQLEFSPAKVKKALGYEGNDRSILVSSDNYVLDGHHQWMAKRETGDPLKVIRLDAPIDELIPLAHEFPSSKTAKGVRIERVQDAAANETRAQRLAGDDQALPRNELQGLSPLRSEGDSGLPPVAGELRTVPEGLGAGADASALAGQTGRAGELRAGELRVDDPAGAGTPPNELQAGDSLWPGNDSGRSGEIARAAEQEFGAAQTGERVQPGNAARGEALQAVNDSGIQGRNLDPAAAGELVRNIEASPLGAIESRVAARNGVESTTAPRPETARLFGKDIAEYPDAELARLRDGLRSESYRTEIDAEIARRTPAPVDTAIPDDGKVNSFAPGASYTGFIDDTPRPGMGNAGTAVPASAPAKAGTRPGPIRREDILIPFMKSLDTGVYEGRVKGKGVMGFFRPKTEEVRIKRHADLETAAHELAHLMDKRIPEIRKSWHSGKDWQIHREELRGVSYDSKKIYEGFAEFVRLHMTQPDVALAKAPVFSKWFEDFTNRHEYGPAIKKAQAGMSEWYAQDAVDRARSKIGKHAPLSDALDGGWDKWRQSIVDDLHGVYRMERDLKGGKIAPAGAYETARLARASHSIADGALRFGAPVKKADGSFAWKGKGLEEILKPVAHSIDDALLYFVGRSARELMTQGREHLFTPGEIDGMLKLRKPEFDQAFKEYQAWNQGVLDFAEAQGVINPESRRLWQRTQYMPFQRIGQPGGFKGKPGDWSGIKALTGGTENIRDILGNMTSNAAQLIDKAVKNEARLKIAELADKVEGGGKFMAKIPAESRPVRIDTRQVIDSLMKAMGVDSGTTMAPAVAKAIKDLRKELESAPAMLELMQTNMPPAGGNVVAVLKGGKPTWYEVGDPILYRALQSIDRPLQSAVVKWLGLPKRIGQMTITLTPDFMVANIARDTIMGSVMSRAGFRPVVDSLNGMRLRLTNDPIYKEAIANGMGMSSMFLDETRFRAKLEKFYQGQGIDYRTVLDAPAKIGNFLETLADSFEISTRLGEYKRAIDQGQHPRHAAYLGREVSTDFAMKGDSTAAGFMFDTVMFLRPALVSWDRLYRGVAHDPHKMAIGAKTGVLAMTSMALYLLNKDDPRYQDLPDWDRDMNWNFFIGGEHFRYPKIWEVGSVASIAERTAEKIINEDPQGLGKDFARILGSTFHLNLKPQIVAPLYEQATNRNNFTDAPIETPGMENMQPFLRAKPTTSETMKALGMATRNMPEALQVNPVRTEALLRGYFNTFAMYGLMLTDKALFGDTLPEMRTDQLPVVRRFYSQEPPLHTKFETQFYDMLGEAKRLHGTMRQLDSMNRPDIADDKEKEPLATEAKPLERAAKNLSGINRNMLAVRRSDSTPAEKRQKLDDLTVERNALLKAAVTESKDAQKAGQ